MKNMKKLLQRAMVFTLSAAMLVGTPMTASAAGLVDLYSISDGNPDHENENGDPNSYTGTVTNTDTNTNTGVIQENDASIIGIVLDQDYIYAEKDGKQPQIKATIVVDGELRGKWADEIGGEATEKSEEEVLKLLGKRIRWQILESDETVTPETSKKLSIKVDASDRTVATLNPRKGTEKDKEMIVKASITPFSKNAKGEVVEKPGAKPFEATAKVYIKEYSEKLWFDWNGNNEDDDIADADGKISGKPEVYRKHTLDLSNYIARDPDSANDTISWTSSDTKLATVNAAGVVSFKNKDGKVTIYATGEKNNKKGEKVQAKADFQITEGVPSTAIEIRKKGEQDKASKINLDLGDDDALAQDLEVVMYTTIKGAIKSEKNPKEAAVTDLDLKKKGNGSSFDTGNLKVQDGVTYYTVDDGGNAVKHENWKITDVIAWSSNKSTIADVKESQSNNKEAKVSAVNVGTAKITAKASSGKSASVSVPVAATLKSLEILSKDQTVYTGQTITLKGEKTPKENKDAVTWFITDSEVSKTPVANKNVSINAKGELKVVNQLKAGVKTEFFVGYKTKSNVKRLGTNNKAEVFAEKNIKITLQQSSVKEIRVTDTVTGKLVANISVKDPEKGTFNKANGDLVVNTDNTVELAVPKGREFLVEATPADSYEAGKDTLAWKTSSEKIAGYEKTEKGVRITANSKGTATITVSGIYVATQNNAPKVIKTTFKIKVKQPVQTVTMNKSSVVMPEKVKNKGKANESYTQKVSLKAVLGPKGVADKNVTWSIRKVKGNADGTSVPAKNGKPVTALSATFELKKPMVGDVYEITAVAGTYAAATTRVSIVNPSSKAAITTTELTDSTKAPDSIAMKDPDKPNNAAVKNTAFVELGDRLPTYTYINIGDKTTANWQKAGTTNGDMACEDIVSYTVNKKGIVTIDNNGVVYAINPGTVKITAKTATGKSASFTVKVYLPKVSDATE